MLKRTEKAQVIEKVQAKLEKCVALAAFEYRGLSVAQLTQLRSACKKLGLQLLVLRNTLVQRALKGTVYEPLSEHLSGPLVFLFSNSEPSLVAQVFKQESAQLELLKVRAIAVEGRVYLANEVDLVAKLPTKLQALSGFLACLQAPMSKWVRTLAEPHTRLARVLQATLQRQSA